MIMVCVSKVVVSTVVSSVGVSPSGCASHGGSVECSLLLVAAVALSMRDKVDSVSLDELHKRLIQLL
jgi:hypothetical protein